MTLFRFDDTLNAILVRRIPKVFLGIKCPPLHNQSILSLNKKSGGKSFVDYYCGTQKVREFSFFQLRVCRPLWESFMPKPEITKGGVKSLFFFF
jgi:hypothetical protein